MDEKSEVERVDEVILPGFRFHPTDEELVGFYLKRKVQQKPLSIELIRQINIYKYDPWDLPKLATTGEKEWYFYCPRDRKYRNSARPNRVTGAGFWKATGTDRPIYSSEAGSKCIGLKKSLVFYKGRAAKGIKTDWMMHEFRLPSLTDTSLPKRTTIDRNIPANDSWAICRIFKKTNSMVQRTMSQSWVSPLTEATSSNIFSIASSCTTTDASIPTINFNNNTFQQQSSTYPTLDTNPYKPINPTHSCKPPTIPNQQDIVPFMFTNPSIPTLKHDIATMLLNMPPTIFEDVDRSSTSTIDFGQQQQQQQCCINGFSGDLPHPMNINMGVTSAHRNQLLYLETMRNAFNNTSTSSWPFTMTTNPTTWDSPSCPSELSGSYNSSKFNC